MITDYSKALGDLTKEEASRIQNEEQLYIRQKEANKRLSKAPAKFAYCADPRLKVGNSSIEVFLSSPVINATTFKQKRYLR